MYIRDRYNSNGDLIKSPDEYKSNNVQELVEFLNEVYNSDENS